MRWEELSGESFAPAVWPFTVSYDGHADEWETSEIRPVRPAFVRLEPLGDREWPAEDRLADQPHTDTLMDWDSRQPDLARGAPNHATAEKGRLFWEHQVRELPALDRAIREDGVTLGLYQSFNQQIYRQ